MDYEQFQLLHQFDVTIETRSGQWMDCDDKEQVRDLGIMMSNSNFHSSY